MLSDIAVTPISETLYHLAAERRSGDLQVHSGAAAKMVFFDHGRVVFAASNLKAERLGEGLVALGRITDEEFERASGLMRENRRLRFGDALVAAGVMDRKAVGTSVAHWVARIVLSLFRLKAGLASFEERPCTIPLEYMVSLSIHRLLYAGINAMSDFDLVRAGLGDLDRTVRLAKAPPFTFELEKCTAEQREVLEAAKVPVTLRRLASKPKGLSKARLRATYAFLASGILQAASDAARAPAARPTAQTETGTFLLSQLQRAPLAPGASPPAPVQAPPAVPAPAAEAAPPAPAPPVETPPPAPGPAEAVAPPAPSPAAEPAAEQPSADHSLEVERLLTQANVSLMVSDLGGAIRAYARVVDLAPDVVGHRARLASLLARAPQTMRQAERQFIEALRLAPDDVDLHYQFGLYYRALKVPSRAIAEFRTVVRLEPRHQGARAQLAAASPDDAVLTTLKKLLR